MSQLSHDQLPGEQGPVDYKEFLFDEAASLPEMASKNLPDPDYEHDEYSVRMYDPNTVYISDYDTIASTTSKDGYLRQGLITVIEAGNELFGIVRGGVRTDQPDDGMDAQSWSTSYMLIRFGNREDEPPELVGPLTSLKEKMVGRTDENGYSPSTSRQHFSVRIVGAGLVRVTDQESSNGTKIAYPEKDKQIKVEPKNLSLSAIKKRLSKDKKQTNPFDENGKIWQLDKEVFDI